MSYQIALQLHKTVNACYNSITTENICVFEIFWRGHLRNIAWNVALKTWFLWLSCRIGVFTIVPTQSHEVSLFRCSVFWFKSLRDRVQPAQKQWQVTKRKDSSFARLRSMLFLLFILALLADNTCSSIVGGLLKPWDISQTIVPDSARDVCSWKLIQPPNILIPYNMCLRSHGDVLSDEIRRVGYW